MASLLVIIFSFHLAGLRNQLALTLLITRSSSRKRFTFYCGSKLASENIAEKSIGGPIRMWRSHQQGSLLCSEKTVFSLFFLCEWTKSFMCQDCRPVQWMPADSCSLVYTCSVGTSPQFSNVHIGDLHIPLGPSKIRCCFRCLETEQFILHYHNLCVEAWGIYVEV